jgi:hypothetical protein
VNHLLYSKQLKKLMRQQRIDRFKHQVKAVYIPSFVMFLILLSYILYTVTTW